MHIENAMTRQFGLTIPVIQAPMAGSGDTPELVAAVCNAGGIGFIGASYLSPEQIVAVAASIRAKTSRPWGINLFAPLPPGDPNRDADVMLARLAPYFTEMGLPAPTLPKPPAHSFDEQFKAALESGAASFSFTFGLLPGGAIAAIKAHGMYAIGTATTVDEAVTLERAGVDAVIAQGSEAGGHRGTFAGEVRASMVGSMALVPQVVDAVRVPVVASGGIMDGRGILAALALGASAVQMGTAFLVCEEAGAAEAYKQAILSAHEDQTRITRAFSGRWARGIVNRFMKEVDFDHSDDAILSFDVQNPLTRPLRTAAAKAGRAEFLSLWAGQGVRMARRERAGDLVARLAREVDAALASLEGRGTTSDSAGA